ncbi:uncharacterized protein LOC124496522 [Dermatophagoides farinae]|uniref:uncharacterized protein LOC124496522 n=1 Tax=Dermatophagoides farinae TaxID=6954 RepID=UPI003F601D98
MAIISESWKKADFKTIFIRGFDFMKIYTFRLQFSIDDYQNQNIPWTWNTFRSTVLFTSLSWVAIIGLGLLALLPNTHPFMSYDNFERILKTERMDIFILAIFIMLIVLEAMWLHLTTNALNYRSSLVQFVINNLDYNENELSTKSLKYLKRFYIIIYFIGITTFRLYIVNAIFTIIFGYYWAIIFYMENLTTFKKLILSMPIFFFICIDIAYLLGQMFTTVLTFIVFVIEFFQVKLEELYRLAKRMFTRSWQNNELKQLFWNRFQQQYVKLYAEIADFNKSFGSMLLYMETVSKTSIIISCMFYSRQKELSQYCLMAILSLMSEFVCVTSLYSRVARLPSYNRRCCKSIIKWLARTQWSGPDTLFYNRNLRIQKLHIVRRTTIKSNLFVQVMSKNELGFTCGHLFFITKFKYIEMLMMNIPLIIMFYEKICMNASF